MEETHLLELFSTAVDYNVLFFAVFLLVPSTRSKRGTLRIQPGSAQSSKPFQMEGKKSKQINQSKFLLKFYYKKSKGISKRNKAANLNSMAIFLTLSYT